MNLKIRKEGVDENGLYKRDITVAKWLSNGFTAREIGEISGLSQRTIEAIVKKMLGVFDCTNTTQLIAELMRRNIIK